MTIRVRFAPSPTGFLHVGNIRTALINWLYAKSKGGQFILRLDDTDLVRSKDEYAKGIQEDLLWLGITFDEKTQQIHHMKRYEEVFHDFKTRGLIYPCYESAEELALKRKTLLNQGKPPLYDRAALNLSEDDRKKLEAQGLKPHWRFKLDEKPAEWVDMVRGISKFSGAFASDPILWREDGQPVYIIASVVDDTDMNITHILRGEDHVANTAVQIKIFEALGKKPPMFGHLPLISDATGAGLSKRLGSMGVRTLKDEGLEPLALSCVLSKLGTGDEVVPALNLMDLAKTFDISKFGRGTPKFNMTDVDAINASIVHMMPYEVAQKRLGELGLPEVSEEVWKVICKNLSKLADVTAWVKVLSDNFDKNQTDNKDFYDKALSVFPSGAVTNETWGLWTTAIKDATGLKGKELFLPLRKALTGFEHGPEMRDVLPLLGRDKIVERLR